MALTANMPIPEANSVKKSSMTSRVEIIGHGIIGFCHGNILERIFPGASRYSQKKKAATNKMPRIRDAMTAAESQGYAAPPQVNPRIINPNPQIKRICPPKSMVLRRTVYAVRRPVVSVSSRSGMG